MSRVESLIGLVIAVVLCFAAAGIGSLLTTPSIEGWYAALRKPAWTPPNWVFGPVWSLLYLMMAVAVWLVWNRAGFAGAKVALSLFAVQLILNVAWSGLFFALQRPALAFLDLLLLWVAILATVIAFFPVSAVAGCLLLPYLLWVAYAGSLNLAIMLLNG
jgi:benzodiazapine receptor